MTISDCPNCGGTHFGSNRCPYVKSPCIVCGDETVLACSDCAIDGKGSVHVCTKSECRESHESTHESSAAGLREGQEPPAEKPLAEVWQMIEMGWSMETRAYFEQEAPKMGFKHPLSMAVHHMHKRCVRENPDFLRAGLMEGPPAPPSHAGDAPATEPELPPSLAASIALFREDPTAWHEEWQRMHDFKVRLLNENRALAASQAGTARREVALTAADVYQVMQCWEGLPASEQQTAIIVKLGQLRDLLIKRGDSPFVEPFTLAAHGAVPPQQP